MSDMMALVKVIILVQLFYSFGITAVTYTLPEDALQYVTGFSDVADEINLETVSNEVTDSLQQQQNLPIVELGALVFFSGNILIDLLLNFAFAIPGMLGMVVQGLMMLFSIDTSLGVLLQIFASVVVTVFYVIGLMQLVVGVRSGRIVG